MKNFEYKNPTKILFGEGQIASLNNEIPENAKVMLLYGGGSIKRNGIYEQVKAALHQRDTVEFGGIPANPEYEILLKALNEIKEEKVDYLLAVGGGSVIDGVKFLAAAALYEGEEPWDILAKNIGRDVGLPFGTVLTLPATGTEMNSFSVISRAETKEKLGMSGLGLFPQFSILDPKVVHSIPKRQIANGIVDAFNHVMEQYITYPANANLQDRIAEGILQTLIEVGPKVMNDPTDYNAAANFMWSCTMALNGLIQNGVPGDWAVHMMGHELTALHQIDHARTLAIIGPNHYKYNFENKKEKLTQFGERVWNITEGTMDEKAQKAIEHTIAFYHQLEVPTKLSEYTENYKGSSQFIVDQFTKRGWTGIGERGDLTPDDVKKIVEMSY